MAASSASPVNSLVREALIEGRTAENKYEKDGYSIKWTFANELDLIFVVRFNIPYLLCELRAIEEAAYLLLHSS